MDRDSRFADPALAVDGAEPVFSALYRTGLIAQPLFAFYLAKRPPSSAGIAATPDDDGRASAHRTDDLGSCMLTALGS